MSEIKSYQDLRVWQEAMTLVEHTYRLLDSMPADEKYGMTQQMRRAAVSVPANIAEGHASNHRRVYLNHLSIARGSLMELETYLALTLRLGLLSEDQVTPAMSQLHTVGRQLSALIRALKPHPPSPNA